MKVLSVISANSPLGGTISKLRSLLLKSKHKHIVYFYCYKDNIETALSYNDFYEEHSIKVFYGDYGRNIFKHAKRISDIVKQERVDIIHLYFNMEQLTAPLLKIFIPQVKLVRSFVGYIQQSKIRKWLMLPSWFAVDKYIYISSYIKKRFEENYPVLRRRSSRIIYNCPIYVRDLDVSKKVKNEIVYVGGLNEHKNTTILPYIVDSMVHKYGRNDFYFKIVGDGPQREEIESTIKMLNVGEFLEMEGYSRDVPSYLERASIYVHPATNEGFGISVVEAMYMNCSCVVSNMGALPELISDGESGFIVEAYNIDKWAEKIIYLLDHEEERQRMGEAAHKRAEEKFSIEAFVQNHDKLYDELLKR